MFLEECKYVVKKKMFKFINDDIDISSDLDISEENPNDKNFDEKNSDEENFNEEN